MKEFCGICGSKLVNSDETLKECLSKSEYARYKKLKREKIVCKNCSFDWLLVTALKNY